MGLPKVVLSDQGREFNNELDTTLASTLGIKRRLTTPYHPQVNHNVCVYMRVWCVCVRVCVCVHVFICVCMCDPMQADWMIDLIKLYRTCVRACVCACVHMCAYV